MSPREDSSDVESMCTTRMHDLLSGAAILYPDRPALECSRRSLSYSALARRVAATGEELVRLGVRPGDRLVIVGANGVEDVTLLFSAMAIGAWPVLLSARLAPAQLDAIVRHCEPYLTLFVAASRDAARNHAHRHDAAPMALSTFEDLYGSIATTRRRHNVLAGKPEPERDTALLVYTSGTTGAPKAAMLSHRNVTFLALSQRKLRRYTETDKTYCALPLSHVGALTILMCVVASGACMYLAHKFEPADLAAAIRDDGVTVVPGLPSLHVKFLDWVAANPGEFDRNRVRLVTTSSSPLHIRVKRAVEELYGCPLQNGYGQTEAGMIFQVEIDRWRDDVSVGPAFPGLDVRIADADGEPMSPGVRGEIQVRGPSVFLGYYRDTGATRAAFTADGWLRTGDIGYFDAAGDAFITGRSSERIRRSGYTIYPAALEGALDEHPAVAVSAVVPGPRAVDEEVVAFVELKRGAVAQPNELVEFLEERVAPYELPGSLRVLDRLPTLANGKIDKVALRRLADGIRVRD